VLSLEDFDRGQLCHGHGEEYSRFIATARCAGDGSKVGQGKRRGRVLPIRNSKKKV
jgi:hypothetical protein